MPWLVPLVNAALKAGAKGAFLSGAGSSIMAIAEPLRGDRFAQCAEERNDLAIATAMKSAAEEVLTVRVAGCVQLCFAVCFFLPGVRCVVTRDAHSHVTA